MTGAAPAPTKPDPEGERHVVVRLLRLAWGYRRTCLVVLGMQAALLALGIMGLRLGGLAIDVLRRAVFDGAPAPVWPFWLQPRTWSLPVQLAAIAAAVLLIAGLRALLAYGHGMTVGRLVHLDVVPALRARVFARLQGLGFRFFDRHASGSLINRVTGDVQSMRSFLDGVLLQGGGLVMSLAVYLVYMWRTHVALTVLSLSLTPLIWLATRRFSRWARPAYQKNRELYDDVVLAMSEGVQGIAVTKVFGREADQLERFQARNRAVLEQQRQIFRRVSRFGPTVQFLAELDIALLLGYGGYLVARGTLSLGDLVVFVGLLRQFSDQLSGMTTVLNTLEQSVAAAHRVFEVLDTTSEVQSPPVPVPMERARGELRFSAVDFAFDARRPVLRQLDLRIEPGRKVAFFGATGAGKTSLLALVPRFYDVSAGAVTLDGHDVRSLDLERLRRQLGIVFQEALLFRGTVAENIAFGRPGASRADIERAAAVAGAHEFVSELPDGYDTLLQEGASNLSGGQRQRLALARALLLDPPVMLLDDPTAAVDAETEHQVLSALARATEGRTTLLVTSRLQPLRLADLIVVIEGGRIIEQGTHEQLVAAGGLYSRAAAKQAGVALKECA